MAEVLIVHPDTSRRAEWKALLEAKGLYVVETGSPAKAAWMVEEKSFCLAIVGWAPEKTRFGGGTTEFLRAMYRSHKNTVTVVCDEAVSEPEVATAIHDAHPAALTHDGRLSATSLALRIDKLFGRRVGDLRLENGAVVHEPTGERFVHNVAIRFMLAHPGSFDIERQTPDSVAIHRFRQWLEKNNSAVDVIVQRGTRLYRMVVRVRTPALVVDSAQVA